MAQAPFVVQPYLTSIALTYRNARMIADEVLPRMTVGGQVFKYNKYTKQDAFTVPDSRVGRKGKVHEIDWTATEETSQTVDYALEDAIPFSDIQNAQTVPTTPIDPRARSTSILTDLIALGREKRAADLVFTKANYGSQSTTLSGDDRWTFYGTPGAIETPTDPEESSNPIADILGAMDSMLMRPNTLVLGRATASALIQHPRIVAAFHANNGTSGIVPVDYLRTLFGLDKVLVGEGWVNTAAKGQTPSMARVWGPHAALLHINPLVTSPDGGVTFGATAEWGSRVAGTRVDPDIGMRGGERVRVGESLKELIMAADCGYMFENAGATG